MSIVQSIIGAVSGGSQPPYYWISLPGGYNEDGTVALQIYWEHARNQTVYWSISNDSAIAGVDFTSNAGYDGSIYTNGSGYTTVATISNVNDNTTEGTEWYWIRLGTYPGGNDLAQQYVNINDTSISATNSFTIEWWQYMDNVQVAAYPRVFDVGNYPNEKPGISFEGQNIVYIWGGQQGVRESLFGVDFSKGQWVHWAIVRNNNTMAFYKNGTNILAGNSLGSVLLNNSSSPLSIGGGSNAPFSGKITGFHWVKGTAKYTSNFVPLRAPTPVITNSKYLLNVVDANTAFADATGNHALQSTVGTVNFSTDTPWTTTATSVSRSTNAYGGPNNGLYELQFDPSFTDLGVVKNGWTVTNGNWSAVVRADAVSEFNAYRVMLYEGATQPPGGFYTFTPPTQTGSLVFNGGYITIAASSDWAIDG